MKLPCFAVICKKRMQDSKMKCTIKVLHINEVPVLKNLDFFNLNASRHLFNWVLLNCISQIDFGESINCAVESLS